MASPESRVTIHMAASLDGFIARRDGRVDWLDTADDGAPAHITILAPFMSPQSIDSATLRDLKQVLNHTPAFRFSLLRVENFVETTYLAPDPGEPFVRMIESVARRYPAYPPFRGKHSTIIPHLTVANGDPEEARIAAESLREIMAVHGPIT